MAAVASYYFSQKEGWIQETSDWLERTRHCLKDWFRQRGFYHDIEKSLEHSLIDLVRGDRGAFIECDGDVIRGTTRKILYVIRQIYNKESSRKSLRHATYAYAVVGNCKLVKELIQTIKASILPNEKGRRAFYALQKLEQLDPTIELLTSKAKLWMQSRNQKVREQAFRCLEGFKEQSGLILNYPVRPAKLLSPFEPVKRPIDPFWRIPLMHLGHCSGQIEAFRGNIRDIAKKEGFIALTTPVHCSLEWLFDPAKVVNERLLVPQKLSSLEDLYSWCECLFGTKGSLMGAVGNSRIAEYFKIAFEKKVDQARFYFEGGNILETVDCMGRKVFLIGASNLLFSLFNFATTFDQLERAYLIRQANMLTSAESLLAKKLARRLIEHRDFKTWNKEKVELLTCCWVAAIPVLLERIRQTLGGKVIQIGEVFAPQPEFHIDMFMCPGPEGKIYMHSFQKALELIERTLTRKDLTTKEKYQLQNYYAAAKKGFVQFQEQLNTIARKLTEEKFIVIPVAGFFHVEEEMTVNYLNAIIGANEEHEFYCITNGSIHSADRFLQKEFIRIMQDNGIKNIYFVGRRTKGEISSVGGFPYIAASESLANDGGIHCRILPLRRHYNYASIIRMLEKTRFAFLDIKLPKEVSILRQMKAIADQEFPSKHKVLLPRDLLDDFLLNLNMDDILIL